MIALIKVGFHHDEEVDEGKEMDEEKDVDEEVDKGEDKEVQKCRMIVLIKVVFHHEVCDSDDGDSDDNDSDDNGENYADEQRPHFPIQLTPQSSQCC